MKDAIAIRTNASFSKEKFISSIAIEDNANTMRVKALTPGSVRYENKTNRLESDSHNCCGYRSSA